MADKELLVTVSPHLHERGQTIQKAMRDVLIALSPVVLVALIVYGMNAIYIIAVSVIVAGLSEWVMRKIMRRKPTLGDLSAMVTGLIFALILPPTTPLWVVAIGSFVAVAIGKELFGGLGKNVFNPALFGRVFLMISPLVIYVSKYAKPFFWKSTTFFTPVQTVVNHNVSGGVQYETLTGGVVTSGLSYYPALTGATPLSLLKSGKMLANTVTGPTPVGATWLTSSGRPSFWSLFLGMKGGCLGEISIIAVLLGCAWLLYRRTIDWRIPVGIIGAFFIMTLVLWNNTIYQLLSGGLFFGAVFMATDWVTSPMTRRGKWIYAVGIGVFVALIRIFAPMPEGVAIAILIWNALTLVIDRYVAEPKFGETKKPWLNRLPVFPKPKQQVQEKATE